ncbi:MAG: DUF971 domain-containing protein [Verrucomicrobiota bacterium]|nr:DUF971 domain-containing protein [Verrucomicrobiota bacterium]
MNLNDTQVIGNELALRWGDGSEQFILLERLRRACPCAPCAGEVDVMGNLHKGPDQALNAASFQIQQIQMVGGYALQVFWADDHKTGLYSYDLLRELPEKS